MKEKVFNKDLVTVEWKLLIPAVVIIAVLIAPLVLFEEQSLNFMYDLYGKMELNLGWFFILSVNIFVVLGFYLMFSKYGNIVLGDPKEKPKMNMFTYISTIICTTLGATIIRTGSGQWAKWVATPALGLDPNSVEAIRQANAYGITFWGFQYMAICSLVIPGAAYMLFVRKRSKLRLSELYREILGDKFSDGILGRIVDIFFIICMTAGNAVVLGLGSPIATTSIAKILNIEPSFQLTFIITVLWVFLFTASVFRGLEKGIAFLSKINIKLAIGIGIFILLAGPTAFIMTYFTDTIGVYISRSVEMMFYTDPVGMATGATAASVKWSIFWWAYDAAASLIYGLFAAQISRGRTIREVLLVYYFTPLLTCFAAHGILGGASMHQFLTGSSDVMNTYLTKGGVHVIPEMITNLPLGNILLVFVAILIVIFLTTTLDSVCYSMACYTEQLDMSKDQPGRFTRIVWAMVISITALLLMNIGGLPPLEMAVVMTGLIMIVAEFMIFVASMKMFNKDKAWIYNVRPREGYVRYESGMEKQEGSFREDELVLSNE
jgi:choline-glycine betaine transporter